MRVVRYKSGKGNAPERDRNNLNELAMLTEAAIAVSNVERWAQQQVSGAALDAAAKAGTTPPKSIIPDDVRSWAKTSQYETTVVETFLRLGAQSFALHGTEALWERQIRSGGKGRPHSVDVALFNAENNEESRIEFGFYSRKKLSEDAAKLVGLASTPDIAVTTNYVMLWDLCENECRRKPPLCHAQVQRTSKVWLQECEAAAQEASRRRPKAKVDLRLASSQDLFTPAGKLSRSVHIGLFSVTAA